MTPRNPQTVPTPQATAPRPHFAPYSVAPQATVAASPHRGAFAIGALIMFFLFSHASEFIDSSGRLHLVLVLGILGAMAVMAVGTFPKVISTPAGVWISLFTVWLVFTIPFSSWRGASFQNFTGLWLKSYVAFFLVGGLIFTVEQCRKSFFWLALSTAAVIYYASRSGINAADDRLTMTYGTLGNSNDLAGVLLVGSPFLIYVAMDSHRNWITRGVAFILCIVLLLVVVRTGSRGAIITIIAMAGLTFVMTSAANKLKMLVLCGLLVFAFPLVVSKTMMARFGTILNSGAAATSNDTASAMESTNARRALMKQGILLTLRHPLFGVGLGNFSHQSANLFIARGEVPLWFTCHDIYLLVSSETGLPGFIMYIAFVVVSFKSLLSMQKRARGVPGLEDVSGIAFCIMVSLTAYLAGGVFSTNAYNIQLPVLVGLTVALERASKPLFDRAHDNQQQQFALAPVFPRPRAARIAPAKLAAARVVPASAAARPSAAFRS